MRILLCNKNYPNITELLRQRVSGHELLVCDPHEVKQYISGVDIVLPSMARIDSDVIESGGFGFVQQVGVGLEGVDISAATSAGVWVANVPAGKSGNADSVAEHTVLLLLALARNLPRAQECLRTKLFFQPRGIALKGKTVCIVGMGDLGVAIARRLAGFGMRMIAVREHPENGAPTDLGIERVVGNSQLTDALGEADFVILAVPHTASTNHLINAHAISSMKQGVFLVNVARGGVVDTDALQSALASGHIAGAGLDVYWQEPVDPTHPLFQQNVIATGHIAGYTDLSERGVAEAVAENILRFARGEPPINNANQPEKTRLCSSI